MTQYDLFDTVLLYTAILTPFQAFALGMISLLFITVCMLLVRIRKLRSTNRSESRELEQTAPPVEQNIDEVPDLPGEAETKAIESSKRIIQELLKSLVDSVDDLLKHQNSYSGKMDEHRVSIRKAMTMAGLEEIQRLLIREVDGMQAVSENYHEQLRKANTRIQDQQKILEKIRIDAKMDFLTRVANRRALEERLKEEFARTDRHGNIFSLIMIDIDLFKKVNDAYGHMAGDKMLQLVAHMIEKQVRITDFVSRFGGEEFAVLLPEARVVQGETVAEKIRLAVETARLKYEDAEIRVTISAGVGEVDPKNDTLETLIARVDLALYKAKQNGRNRTEIAEQGLTNSEE